MREIKFRVWDKTKNVMRNPLFHAGSALTVAINDLLTATELMQYTGLKDKNGVEIYEGDLVKVFEDNEFAPSIYTQRVEMHNGCWRPTMMFVNGNQVEVIGNIYENPELMKD